MSSRKKMSTADLIHNDQLREAAWKRSAMTHNRNYSKEIYDLGTEWALAGKELEQADPKIRENRSFTDGFERGKRLKFIKETEEAENQNKKTR